MEMPPPLPLLSLPESILRLLAPLPRRVRFFRFLVAVGDDVRESEPSAPLHGLFPSSNVAASSSIVVMALVSAGASGVVISVTGVGMGSGSMDASASSSRALCAKAPDSAPLSRSSVETSDSMASLLRYALWSLLAAPVLSARQTGRLAYCLKVAEAPRLTVRARRYISNSSLVCSASVKLSKASKTCWKTCVETSRAQRKSKCS